MPDNVDGWNEYRRLILSELERLDDSQKESAKVIRDAMAQITVRVNKLNESVVALQVKAGIWGILGGILAAIGSIPIGML